MVSGLPPVGIKNKTAIFYKGINKVFLEDIIVSIPIDFEPFAKIIELKFNECEGDVESWGLLERYYYHLKDIPSIYGRFRA